MPNSNRILNITAREVLDSRGNPTIEVDVHLSDGTVGSAIVPSGASKGKKEALELRDQNPHRFLGKGVLKAIENVQKIIHPASQGKCFESLATLDSLLLTLDSTIQKTVLGANTTLGVSMAFAKALSLSQKRPLFLLFQEWMGGNSSHPISISLPVPLMNLLNGGVHANNGLSIQEFMIVPHGFSSFSEALRAGCEVFHTLKNELSHQHLSTAVGDEGGFAPSLPNETKALQFLVESIQKAGYQLGKQISLALDVAASSFYSEEKRKYSISIGAATSVSTDTLIQYYDTLQKEFPLVSIEDGLDENDWDGWKKITNLMGDKIQLVGDDLFVTQKPWVEKGIQENTANAVLIKMNQVGTLTETLDCIQLCKKYGYNTIVSHRSGESEDTTIAHLAVGTASGQIKTGSVSRSERTAKYNELLRIEEWCKNQNITLPYGSSNLFSRNS